MDTIVFGQYTVQQLLIYGGIAAGAIILLMLLKKLFTPEEKNEHIQVARCDNCGWQGQVSRYAGRCPKCSQPLGQQKAQGGT